MFHNMESGCDYMLMTEKELNCHLLDMIDLLDDIQEIAEEEKAVKTLKEIEKKRRQINRKLYQKPPLINE